MGRRIIGANSAATQPAVKTANVAPAPSVQRLTVDEGSQGQRLDNVLLRVLQGVPTTHVYRVIPGGAHDFRVWKSDLYHFAQLIFREAGQVKRFERFKIVDPVFVEWGGVTIHKVMVEFERIR